MDAPIIDRREHPRFMLPPMHAPVTIQRIELGSLRPLEGHAYNVSERGLRFEIDEVLEPNEYVAFRLTLPQESCLVSGRGRVVWVADDLDDPGPRRAGLLIETFEDPRDAARLTRMFGSGALQRAA